MNRFPSGDEIRHRFVSPRPSRYWMWTLDVYRKWLLRREHMLAEYAYEELDRMRDLLGGGARFLIAPNHTDHADGLALYELANKLDTMFCYMATHQLFEGTWGLRWFVFPRYGAFPIDREGAGLSALKAAKNVLLKLNHPLVVFPEGEIYHTNDRLTPLREGAAAMALTAQRALKNEAPVYIVPVALKYRYLDPEEALGRLSEQLGRLEERLTWRARPDQSLPRRIYRFASGLMSLKEVEFLGSAGSGTVAGRVENLRDGLLERLEDRYLGRIGTSQLPERVSAVHRRLIELRNEEDLKEERRAAMQRDLDALFLVLQLFSYPADYIHECPTVERVAETLIKFEEDLSDSDGYPEPAGKRRLTFRIGEPIDMRDYLAKPSRGAVSKCTDELSRRLQAALDEIGMGTPLKELGSSV
ncbi:MAG: 1-acyl-sn-glycerol-3-phosphate acyltransferase, partial [Akkermansiaceae bacterium]|nr:1-acyl-sn-glycerol-3-phosphate acyltransferase [Akkermansiaceae bacterium]